MTFLAQRFTELTACLHPGGNARFVLAELNDLLTDASAEDLPSLPRPNIEDHYLANYVAAMIEQASHRKNVYPPKWTAEIVPLRAPVFAMPGLAVRAHLLLESPPPFRRRNIFIDSSIGARV